MGVGAAPYLLLALFALVVGHGPEGVDLCSHYVFDFTFEDGFKDFGLALQIREVVCLSEKYRVTIIQKHNEIVSPTF